MRAPTLPWGTLNILRRDGFSITSRRFGNRERPALPLPSFLFVAFATGLAAALVSRRELLNSPQPLVLMRSLSAWAIFAGFLLLPLSAYFYLFHGDWFLLYRIDVSVIPSAVALLVFIFEFALGALGYFLSASLIRRKKSEIASLLLAVVSALVFAPIIFFRRELAVVGTYRQFHRGYGLEEFQESALFPGSLFMGGVLIVAFAYLLIRLSIADRRYG